MATVDGSAAWRIYWDPKAGVWIQRARDEGSMGITWGALLIKLQSHSPSPRNTGPAAGGPGRRGFNNHPRTF